MLLKIKVMYKLDVLEVKDFQIEKTQTKGFYDLRGEKSLSKWMRTKNFKLDSTSIATTNGLTVSQKEKDFKVPKNYMGYLHDHSNNVQYNTSGVGLYTTMFSDAHGTFFDDTNYEKIILSKDTKGIVSNYQVILDAKLIIQHNETNEEIVFQEKQNIKNNNNTFDQKNYEKMIKRNFAISMVRKLNLELLNKK